MKGEDLMKKIGITGGIGSGKTTVCDIFKLLGVPVFHADFEAKYLQNYDTGIKNQIIMLLGDQAYNGDGVLDRQMVAGIIFNNPKALAAVNQIIHPAVRQRFVKWCMEQQDVPYVLYEAAILFESGYAMDFDRTILVLADEKTRINRVIKRDHVTEEFVKQRISNQLSDSEKINRVDYLIDNNNESLLFPQILKIDQLIREDGKIR